MAIIPNVIERTGRGERGWDIYSRLLKDRIIFLGYPINDEVANIITAQLLFLDSTDRHRDIQMYINSPGGSVYSGLGVYDTMQYVTPDVATICIGMAASAAALLLTAGAAGKRFTLPHSTIMIHQPLGGVQGQATEIEIHAREILRMRDVLNDILVRHTGQPKSKIAEDTERDRFMTPDEARTYGLIDEVIVSRDGKSKRLAALPTKE